MFLQRAEQIEFNIEFIGEAAATWRARCTRDLAAPDDLRLSRDVYSSITLSNFIALSLRSHLNVSL